VGSSTGTSGSTAMGAPSSGTMPPSAGCH
jgi:hypothetical protein